jgi:CBS domain-containing protein
MVFPIETRARGQILGHSSPVKAPTWLLRLVGTRFANSKLVVRSPPFEEVSTMVLTTQPFLRLTAADLMSRPVVLLPQEMSLQGAARLLAQAQISGAPVVDAEGRCVGVLSANDFVRVFKEEKQAALPRAHGPDEFCFPWAMGAPELVPEGMVCHHMTSDPVTVLPQAGIGDLAQSMIDAHIHRVIVVDEERRPVGVVSTTDILAAVAQATRRPSASGLQREPAPTLT